MGEIAVEAVIQAGVIYDGWKRGMSVKESRDVFKKHIKTIKRQASIACKTLPDEDSKNIARSLEMFNKDKKSLETYIINKKIHKDLFEPAFDYIKFLNNLITTIRAAS